MVLLHHATKNKGYRGSTAIGATVDVICEMDKGTDRDEPNVRELVCCGRVAMGTSRISFDPARLTWDRIGEIPTAAQKTDDREQRVLELVRHNAGCGKEAIRKAVGGKGTAVDDAIKALLQAGTVQYGGRKGGYRRARRAVERGASRESSPVPATVRDGGRLALGAIGKRIGRGDVIQDGKRAGGGGGSSGVSIDGAVTPTEVAREAGEHISRASRGARARDRSEADPECAPRGESGTTTRF